MKRSATSVSLINKSHVQAPKIKVLVFLISEHQIKTARHSLRRFIIVNCGSPKQSAILSVIEGHSQRYIPKVMQLDLPTPLSILYSSTQLEMDFSLLLVESTKVFDDLHLTKATDGVRESYVAMMQDHHDDFQVRASGFIINPELPWIRASPDGVVSCTCHGDGVLEIKCPFKTRNCSLTESCKDSSFCLGIGEDGVMALRHIHKYMFQVQAQMHIAEEVFTQRILYDPLFFHDAYGKVVNFIKTGVLPELMGKWYTAPRLTPIDTTATKQPHEAGCYCGQPAGTDVIICTSGNCRRKRFHKTCLKLTRVPKTWRCVECRKQV
ncbi:uncharacterized protein LOC130391456 [Gadus chalcogrammus]|uniref:uncharacterized protein LOC130391456 n=1 Tax=Gadus chalcogrammus TaxID=1042646 RepID=UPI0024C4C8F5|nr:uncharacterized protein LOC130391456 [Gadus chalcogrammus]